MTQATPAEQELGRQVFAALDKGKPGMPEAVRLVQQGADVGQTDTCGHTALLIAAARNYQPLVRAVLARGANPDMADLGGQTPLMEAVIHSYTAVAKMLIDAGADITLKNLQGQTAGDLATQRHNDRNARLLGEWSRAAARHREEQLERTAVEVWADSGLPAQRAVSILRPVTFKNR